MIEKIVTGVGLVLGILAWIFPVWSVAVKIGVSCALVAGIAATWAVEAQLALRRLRAQRAAESQHPLRILPEMTRAFDEIREMPVRRVRYLAYAGNFIARTLPHWDENVLDGLDLRLLLRDPRVPWNLPPDGTVQQASRKTEIQGNLCELLDHHALSRMLHRAPKVNRDVVRFFLSEPVVRVLLAEFSGQPRRLYLGFYPAQPRSQGVSDFSGTGRPVIALVEDMNLSTGLMDDFVSWFEFNWDTSARPSQQRRPLLALDFDGVIADTNRLKAEWIRINLKKKVAPERCNRTDCVRLIGEDEYEQLSDYAYGEAATKDLAEVPGLQSALHRHAPRWRMVVLTARTPERTEYAKKWLQQRGLADSFEEVISVRGSKGQRAAELGAQVLVDDDPRHVSYGLPHGPIPVLFSPAGCDRAGFSVGEWTELSRFLDWTSNVEGRLLTTGCTTVGFAARR